MRCDQCKFWSRTFIYDHEDCDELMVLEYEDGYGGCQRFPPVMIPSIQTGCPFKWENPATHASHWCGEFKPLLEGNR